MLRKIMLLAAACTASVLQCAVESGFSVLQRVAPLLSCQYSDEATKMLKNLCSIRGDHHHYAAKLIRYIDPATIQTDIGTELVFYALCSGNINVAELLVRHKADLERRLQGHTLLQMAAMSGETSITQSLIRCKAYIGNNLECTPLMLASAANHPTVVYALRLEDAQDVMLEYLLAGFETSHVTLSDEVREAIAKADAVRARQSRALSRVLLCTKTSPLLRFLPPSIIDTIDDYATTVFFEKKNRKEQLWQACCGNNSEDDAVRTVKTILRGSIIDVSSVVSSHEITFLQHATQHGYTESVRCLLKHGANPDIVVCKGVRPFLAACLLEKVGAAEVLREYAANDCEVDWHSMSVAVRGACGQVDTCRKQCIREVLSEIPPGIIDLIGCFLVTPIPDKPAESLLNAQEISQSTIIELVDDQQTSEPARRSIKHSNQCCGVM